VRIWRKPDSDSRYEEAVKGGPSGRPAIHSRDIAATMAC